MAAMDKDKRSGGVRPRNGKTRTPAPAAGKPKQNGALPTTGMDLSGWPTKGEVAQRFGIAVKTIDRMVAAGKLEQAYMAMPGRRPVPVLNPRDVETLGQSTSGPKPFVVPPGRAAEPYLDVKDSTAIAAPAQRPLAGSLPVLFESLQAMARVTAQPYFLNIEEAVRISGLPKGTIMRMIRHQNLPAMRTGSGYRIHRRDIEQL